MYLGVCKKWGYVRECIFWKTWIPHVCKWLDFDPPLPSGTCDQIKMIKDSFWSHGFPTCGSCVFQKMHSLIENCKFGFIVTTWRTMLNRRVSLNVKLLPQFLDLFVLAFARYQYVLTWHNLDFVFLIIILFLQLIIDAFLDCFWNVFASSFE